VNAFSANAGTPARKATNSVDQTVKAAIDLPTMRQVETNRDLLCMAPTAPPIVYLKAQPDLNPTDLKTRAAGQNPVNEACNMLRPAKATSRNHQGDTQ
jgi:hypothetical protein